ncbi:conserved membrane hypothetical protein [Acidobacteriia bacterium SbA2]|nr:conserved membrane hypothetical protein [Acidobacteriia bacterium SbA2]
MRQGQNPEPPRWLENLLTCALPPSRQDDIPGDLREEFHARSVRGVPVNLWYIRQVAGLIGRQLYSGGKMRTLLLTCCGFTLLACVWLTTMESILRHPGYPSRMILDALLGAGSLAIGLVVLFLATTIWRWLALAAAVAAGGVGISAIVRDARAVHFEGFVLLIGSALSIQAALSIWVLVFRPRRERT